MSERSPLYNNSNNNNSCSSSSSSSSSCFKTVTNISLDSSIDRTRCDVKRRIIWAYWLDCSGTFHALWHQRKPPLSTLSTYLYISVAVARRTMTYWCKRHRRQLQQQQQRRRRQQW